MFSWLNKYFVNEEQIEGLSTPKGEEAKFVLMYKDLTIGYLNHTDSKWVFKYSEQFKVQSKIDALVDFPKKSQIYEASYLWPFFAHRIPGLGQPQIQRIIKEEHLNPKNEIDLLRRFGQKTITNPFELSITA
jgi:HipA-like protein